MIVSDPAANPKKLRWPSCLSAARWSIMIAIGAILLLLGGLLGHFLVQSRMREQSAARWVAILDLSMPALWPSGASVRAPELANAAVIPRLYPGEMGPYHNGGVLFWRLNSTSSQVAP
jgi:hypothetical protein